MEGSDATSCQKMEMNCINIPTMNTGGENKCRMIYVFALNMPRKP